VALNVAAVTFISVLSGKQAIALTRRNGLGNEHLTNSRVARIHSRFLAENARVCTSAVETVAARHLARRCSKRGFSAIVQNTDEGIAKHEFP